MALSTKTNREKYLQSSLAQSLKTKTVATAICKVDESANKFIQSPFLTDITAQMGTMNGAYTTAASLTTTDDTLTVTEQIVVPVHIYDFESRLAAFDLMADALDNMTKQATIIADKFVVNSLTADAGESYTVTGGFTAANVPTILGDLIGKVAGYADSYNNMFLVLENTEYSALVNAGVTNGFNTADETIRRGQVANWMGIDMFVVRTGTFASATVGTRTFTNSGHRVFGVKNVATFAMPRGLQYDEFAVDLKTGKQLRLVGAIGFKLWTPVANLVVDITL